MIGKEKAPTRSSTIYKLVVLQFDLMKILLAVEYFFVFQFLVNNLNYMGIFL